MAAVTRLAVIGNISLDHTIHPDDRQHSSVGGAALYVALAAAAAALPAAPVAVIGSDLRWLPHEPSLAGLDWSAVQITEGVSAAFTLAHNAQGDLTGVHAEHRVAEGLTQHALRRIASSYDDAYHVCCRTPLDISRVLEALTQRSAHFSADFIISSAADATAAATPYLRHARVVFTNATEHHILAAATPLADLPAVVVSDGPRPARLYRHGRLTATMTPPPTIAVRPTGAGDTLAGTFLAALAAGQPDTEALHTAVTAASAHTTRPAIPVRYCTSTNRL